MNVDLIYRDYDEIKSVYPDIFQEIFGYWEEMHVPGYVLLVMIDGEYAGFLACYDHQIDTVYIQFCGFKKEYRKSFSIGVFREIVRLLHLTYRCILGRIHNGNIKALQVALFAGFKVIGCRQASDNNLYLEIMKMRTEITYE
jgi:hypothetical protein